MKAKKRIVSPHVSIFFMTVVINSFSQTKEGQKKEEEENKMMMRMKKKKKKKAKGSLLLRWMKSNVWKV